jgi:hypothetical protein
LDKKGTIQHLDNYTVIRIFGSTEQPALLPCHITEIIFIAEVTRQYNYWFHLFQRKKKKQFIPMPWKIGELVLKNVNKFDDFATHFSISNPRYAEHIKGFNPYDIFRQHLHSLGLDDCFVNKHLPKNKDSHGPTSDACDVETVQSCTKLYTQQGKDPSDKSVQSANTTPKSTTSRSIARTAHHNNKETQNSSNGGGDNDPPHSKIDSSHKLLVEKKRKKNVG